MNHDRWEQLGSRYRDGDLDASESALFEEHMEACEACREIVEADSLLGDGLKMVLDGAFPADFEQRTLALVGEETGGTSPDRRLPSERRGPVVVAVQWLRHGEFRLPAPVAVAAAALLVVLGALVLGRGAPFGPRAGEPQLLISAPVGEAEWIEADAAEAEIRSLLRRTRTLLLALATAEPDEEGRYNLDAEEALSKDLIHEVRMVEASTYLDEDTDILDLIQDLELILLDVSTWQGEADANQLAMLRDGISGRSLIYRISTYEPHLGGD